MTDVASQRADGAREENGATSPNRDVALRLAEAGFFVHPCRPDKAPWTKWAQESTRDPETILHWWRQWQDALVGIDCGKSGLLVVDCDRKPGKQDGVAAFDDLIDQHGWLDGTPVTTTPGNGYHYYFRQPNDEKLRNRTGALPEGIDIRGAGGYVIAPGSVLPEGRMWLSETGTPDLADAYAAGSIHPVPAWLIDRIKAAAEDQVAFSQQTEPEPTAEQSNSPKPHTAEPRLRSYALTALERNAADLAARGLGKRNITLNNVALRAGRMAASGWLAKEEALAAFHDACISNGYIKEAGEKASYDTFESGFSAGLRRPLSKPATYEALGAALNETCEPNAEILEAPRPLYRPMPAAAPYPVDALGDILAAAARAIIDRIQCPDALAAQSVLGVASLAVQAHADVEIPATGHAKPTSLNLVTIAPSGERKSAADAEALSPVRKREKALRETFNAEMKDFMKARKAWESAQKKATGGQEDDYSAIKGKLEAIGDEPPMPLMPMLTCHEPTFEGLCKLLADGQPAMGIFSDEGGSFIAGHGMSPDNRLRTVAGLSSIWDGSPIKRVRVIDGSSIIDGKRVALHLMAQPEAASRLLADPVLKDQGFLSRLLVAAPTSTAGTRFQRQTNPTSATALNRYYGRMLSILECKLPLAEDTRNELQPRVLRFAADAAQDWGNFADEVEAMLAPGQPFEPIRGFANKLPEHAARIAAVLKLVDHFGAAEIDRATFGRAILLAKYYAYEALRLFGTGYASPELRRAETLRKWLLEKWDEPLISLRAIVRLGPNEIRDSGVAKDAIKVLVDHFWLVRVGPGQVEGQNVREAWRIVNGADE